MDEGAVYAQCHIALPDAIAIYHNGRDEFIKILKKTCIILFA
jgi:hypothetical protein